MADRSFNEDQHRRVPKGSPQGGRFISASDATRSAPSHQMDDAIRRAAGRGSGGGSSPPPRPAGPAGDDDLPPLTDAEFAAHLAHVRQVVMDAVNGGRSTAALHKTADGEWTEERRRLHADIVNTLYVKAAHIPNGGEAVFSGGLAGSGKTSTLRDHAGINPGNYLTINTDDVKAEFARRGLIPDIPGLAPLERQMLIREEAAHVTKLLTWRAVNDRKNVIFDVVMGPGDDIRERLAALREAGYLDFRAVYVDVPIEVAMGRAEARYRYGLEEYRNGRGVGERWAPWEGMLANRSPDPRFTSVNRLIFESVRDQFNSAQVWDNSVDGRSPQRIDP